MASIVRTTVYADEEKEFRMFLEDKGFSEITLFPNKGGIYLNIQFHKPAAIMNYTLRGVESEYKSQHSNTYFYDLDQDWDDEADDFFGDDDDR